MLRFYLKLHDRYESSQVQDVPVIVQVEAETAQIKQLSSLMNLKDGSMSSSVVCSVCSLKNLKIWLN